MTVNLVRLYIHKEEVANMNSVLYVLPRSTKCNIRERLDSFLKIHRTASILPGKNSDTWIAAEKKFPGNLQRR